MVRYLSVSLVHLLRSSRSVTFSDPGGGGQLAVPRSRLQTKSDHAFEAVAPTLWDAPPLDSRSLLALSKAEEDSSVQISLCRAPCVCIWDPFMFLSDVFISSLHVFILKDFA